MLTPGLVREARRRVTENESAAKISPLVPAVYASAHMIAFAETICAELMAEHLPPTDMSVGSGFTFTHEAATPIGMEVTMRVTLVEVAGRRHVFEVEGRDERDRICVGRHERFSIDKAKFLGKLEEKARAVRS